jgi:hypothetical protein
MPVKLNVGLSKKIGLPDYGSLGANVNLELELDSSVIGNSDRLRQEIRQLFGQAESSIEEQLSSLRPGPQRGNRHSRGSRTNTNEAAPSQQSVRRADDGNGEAPGRSTNHRVATHSQIRAIRAISQRQGLNLGQLLGSRFRLREPEELSLTDASALIDELKNLNPC